MKPYLQNPNLAVPFLLMASYLYYIRDESPPITDLEFDALCRFAHDQWSTIQHRHKYLIKKPWLAAGSLYKLRDQDYPLIVKGAAYSWLHGAHNPHTLTVLNRIASAVEKLVKMNGLKGL